MAQALQRLSPLITVELPTNNHYQQILPLKILLHQACICGRNANLVADIIATEATTAYSWMYTNDVVNKSNKLI